MTKTEVVEQGSLMQQQRPSEMSATLIEAIVRAAKDPSVDVEKMGKLLDIQLRLVAIAAEASFSQAFARLQPKMPRITKDSAITLGAGKGSIPYAKYEDICRVVLPLLHAEGFSVSFSERLSTNPTLMEVIATFRHEDGHKETGSAFVPLTDDSGAKNKVQGGGSAYAYGQRYAFSKFLNIITEDEDDNGASAKAQRKPSEVHEAKPEDVANTVGAFKAARAEWAVAALRSWETEHKDNPKCAGPGCAVCAWPDAIPHVFEPAKPGNRSCRHCAMHQGYHLFRWPTAGAWKVAK